MSHSGDTPQQPGQPYGDQPTPPYGQQPQPYGQQPPTGSGGSYGGSYGGPDQYGGGYGGGQLDPSGGQKRKGFIPALFDLSFTTFVTPTIIRVVYVIGMIAIVLGTLFFALSGFFGDSPGLGIVTLIVAPIAGLLYLCLFRMMCEFYLAITRMSEDINRRLPQS